MNKKPRQNHLSKVWIKKEKCYTKRSKPWNQREVEKSRGLEIKDLYLGFQNKQISVRDSQYRVRMG